MTDFYYITPYILVREMVMLCGIRHGRCQLRRWYDIGSNRMRCQFWCRSHGVDIGDLDVSEFTLPIEEFSKKHLAPAANKWRAREGERIDDLDLRGIDFSVDVFLRKGHGFFYDISI